MSKRGSWFPSWLGPIFWLLIFWALLFGVNVNGRHYGLRGGCDDGLTFNTGEADAGTPDAGTDAEDR